MKNIINLTKMSFNNLTSVFKYVCLVTIIWALVSIVNPSFLGMLFGIGTYMLLYQVMAYEDINGIDNLISTLPVKRSEYIISRYVLGIILSVLSIIISIAIYFFINSTIGSQIPLNVCIVIGLVTSVLTISTTIPIVVKLGVTKGRILALVIPIAAVVIPSGIIDSSSGNTDFMIRIANMIDNIGLPMIITISSIVILSVSMIISLKLYSTKEVK
jgi:ABC-2 type transport system permease protein